MAGIPNDQPPLAHHLPDRTIPLLEGAVGDALRATAARFPERTALVWADGDGLASLTYFELLEEAQQVAFWLLGHGVPGDRVGIWSRNTLEWMLLEYGCALAGMVIAAWNPGWSDFECEHARELTEPVVVLAGMDTRGVSLVERARAVNGTERTFVLEELRARAAIAEPCPLPKVTADDLFLIQFTSGTTGRAKGAALSNRTALNGAWLRTQAGGADETDVWLNPSPMSHMGGAVTMLPGAMVTGSTYVILNRFEAGEFVRMMRLCGATRIGGVPTMLIALLEHPDWQPASVHLRALGSGGAQVPQPLIERLMREFDAPVLVAYAQSEAPMITSSLPGDDARMLAETVGRVSPHVELKIVDRVTGNTVTRGEAGEICVRGPITMQGYFRMPEATAAAIDADGFLHTGDLGWLGEDGFLRVHGRAREVIIRGGENIYPAEVEDALLAHPEISEVAVVGIPDDRWGQQVGAAMLLRSGSTLTGADIEAHAATRLAHFKVPRRWLFVDSFPLTPSGKIRKVEVETMFVAKGNLDGR